MGAVGGAAQPGEAAPRLALRGVTKRYGLLVANDAIDLTVARGEIHAVVGENGAGKTTLMRVLYGMVRPDAGTIELDGVTTEIANPAHAIRLGIGMVHQRFELVEEFTALENLVLGAVPRRLGVVFDRARARADAERLAAQLGARLAWGRLVRDLGVGARQRLEIMRLLYHDADVLIFDEPTSVLTPQEADDLFAVLRRLAAGGRTILFISHKLREVFALADRVTVIRRGRVVWTGPVAGTDAGALAAQIVGERFEASPLPRAAEPGEAALRAEDLAVADDLGAVALRGATFAVRAGEVVGVAGVEGSGQRELVEALVGLRRPLRGGIRLGHESVAGLGVRARRRRGLAYISADRDEEGACQPASLAENLVAGAHRRPPFGRGGLVRWDAVRRWAAGILARFDVRGGGPTTPARALSGGNLQRLVVGRELHQAPRVLVAAHPTRGVDVRGIAFIHAQLAAARDAGAAIVLVSEDLGELIQLADRLLVVFDGRVVAEVAARDATPERVGRLMTGVAA